MRFDCWGLGYNNDVEYLIQFDMDNQTSQFQKQSDNTTKEEQHE
jgi:hypothetical protein